MTTQTGLTPSQAAFKFFEDLLLDPVLLAAYAEKCSSVNAADNPNDNPEDNKANETLTGWMGKLGYPGASPGLVYQVLQFWQSQSLWLWQGEYNQNFYYPPDGNQVNQYSLKILADENGDFSVTLNGEALTYSLAVDDNYLVLSWSGFEGNSAEGSVTFYYSPECLLSESSIIQYSGNFFNGYINGSIFKGALLTQTDQQSNSSQHPWYHVFWTDTAKVVESVVAGVLVVGGYGLVAKRKGYWPFRKSNKAEGPLGDDPNALRKLESGFEPNDPYLGGDDACFGDDAQLKEQLMSLSEDRGQVIRQAYYEYLDLNTQLGKDSQYIASKYRNLVKAMNGELNLDFLGTRALRRVSIDVNNEIARLGIQYPKLKREFNNNNFESKELAPEAPEKLANQIVENQQIAEEFQVNPDKPLNPSAIKTVKGLNQEVKAEADDNLKTNKLVDEIEEDILEDGAGA